MAECSYTFADADGKQVTLNGKPAIKAAIADGELDHLLPSKMLAALDPGNNGAKFSRAGSTIIVDGVSRPTTNSKGQPIHPTEEGLRNFWRWFGDSKAVDAQGRPVVVYHGTTKSIAKFSNKKVNSANYIGASKDAHYFSDNNEVANSYAGRETSGDLMSSSFVKGGNVIPSFVSIKNPLVIDAKGEYWDEILYKRKIYTTPELAAIAKKEGFDGLVIKNVVDMRDIGAHGQEFDKTTEPSTTYISFSPEQIKSAVGNTGAFSGQSPDIRYSRGDSSDSIHPEDAEASLRIVRKAYPGVQFVLHDSDTSKTVPKELRVDIKKANASGDVKGAYHNGEIHLFRSAIPDIKEFEFTAAHESTHFGLSSMLGPELDAVMLHINKSNPTIAERAQTLQDKYGYSVARSTEEALADLGGDMVKVNGWKRLVALVRDFLRRHGFVSRWTDNDIVALIQSARDYAKNPNATTVYRGSVFSRADAATEQAEPDKADAREAGSWPKVSDDTRDKFVYTMQDKQVDTKRTVEAAKKAGINVSDDINPYLQEELYHGRRAKRVEDFRDGEVRQLVQAMQSAKLSEDEVNVYLWAQHAKERNAQIAKINEDMPDGGSGLTNQQAADLLAGKSVTINGKEIAGVNQTKRPALSKISKIVGDISSKNLQDLVESGMEKQETVDAMKAAYQSYVPLQREEMDDGRLGTGMGFSVRGSASKRATGSDKTVVDILGNLLNQRERTITRIEKNRVGQSVLGLAKAFPDSDIWTVDTPPKIKTVESQTVFTAYDKAGNVLGKYNTQQQADKAHPDASVTIKRSTEDRVVERIDPTFRSNDEVFHVRVNGEDKFVIFNKKNDRAMRMAAALKNLDADQLGAVLQVTSKATRYFAAMATQYNPLWGAVNLVRDVQGALLNLSTTPIRGQEKKVLAYTMSALKGIWKDARAHRKGEKPTSEWAKVYEEMQDEGGQTGYMDMFATGKDRTEALNRELDPSKWAESPLGRIFTAGGRLKVPMEYARKQAEGFFGVLSDYNESMENAVRAASYKVAIESGMSKQQAASIAKNVTVNFNRKGQVATQAGALYAFFNASMQGSARLFETLSGPLGKKIIAGGVSLGVMQAMLLAAAGMGDDEPPEFVRERSLIIPTGDGKYVSIPMPLGFHVLPNLGRIPAEYALGGFKGGAKKLADIFSLLADTFNPTGSAGMSIQTLTPTVIDPLAALAENKDWTGKQIYKEDTNGLHPTAGYLRAKDTATTFSKALAKLINASTGGTDFKPGVISPTPDQLDYLIGQAFGGVGREALKIEQTGGAMLSGEELPAHKIPLLGRFYGDSRDQSAESGKFYEALKRINMHQAEIKGLREKGRTAELSEYIQENPESRLVAMAQATERAVGELRQQKTKALEKGDSDRVKQLEGLMRDRMHTFNERVQSLSKQ